MEKESPLISVIVPNYNHEKYLKQRLESIFNQTYPNFEVILLDDCSTDNSRVELLLYAEHPKVSYCIFNSINSGDTFIQWNKGIALAKGDYIWIAETDDFCELNFLDHLIQPLLQDSEIALAYCQSNRVNEDNEVTGNWLNHTNGLDTVLFLNDFTVDGNDFIERFLVYKNVIPNASAVVFRKSSAIELGDLDTNHFLKYCGDWLFYIKLISDSKITFKSTSLNYFRYHSKSVIALADENGKLDSNNGIEVKARIKIIDFLSCKKIINLPNILKINNQIINELKYEKAFYLIRNNNKFKGFLILFSIFNIFVDKYRFKKKLKSKICIILKFIK
jgi:glycosyltransferase involved in cell wall biosynthesis